MAEHISRLVDFSFSGTLTQVRDVRYTGAMDACRMCFKRNVSMTMDTTPSNAAQTAPNGAHDLLARLYREIGIAAVAAALEPAALAKLTVAEDAQPKRAPRARRTAKAA